MTMSLRNATKELVTTVVWNSARLAGERRGPCSAVPRIDSAPYSYSAGTPVRAGLKDFGWRSASSGCVGTHLQRRMVGMKPVRIQPQRANQLSPARQRWEKWEKGFESRRDSQVLTRTLPAVRKKRSLIQAPQGPTLSSQIPSTPRILRCGRHWPSDVLSPEPALFQPAGNPQRRR
jgi:hypothetical protein